MTGLQRPFISDNLYRLLFLFLGIVYAFGLFVPLMDNDSAHHANIALHMHLTGDYASLVDYNGAYLDKPHLHFWLAAMAYKIFGVTGFAYKLPSLLFSILGVYSTYRLGKSLYNKETGKLAALILASSFAFILANNDVRMDAILTACIAFASWQLVDFIQWKKWMNVAGAALGLALGFSTKGNIAVFVPAVGAFFYILYYKDWKIFINPKWLVLLLLFAIGITPVVYCYYLQYNLHPEVVVRGKDHIDGVTFILFNQSVERFAGEMGHDARNDYFFFLHSFLWAFAPWSFIAYYALFLRLKNFLKRKDEWFTPGVIIVIIIVVSISGFKLPHYLNIVFPAASVLTASWLMQSGEKAVWLKPLQLGIAGILFAGLLVINFWAFPIKSYLIYAGLIITLALFMYSLRSVLLNRYQQSIVLSVAVMICVFFLLNTNFYPQLLRYQGGNNLAQMPMVVKGHINHDKIYVWKRFYSSSFEFYTSSLRKEIPDTAALTGDDNWLLYDIKDSDEILKAGYKVTSVFNTPDFEITKLDLPLLNPEKRDKLCSVMVLGKVEKVR